MKSIFFILFVILFTKVNYSQQNNEPQKVATLKKEYISKKLELSPQESQTFFPIYDEYTNKRREIRKNIKSSKGENSIEEVLIQKQDLLNLDKEYSQKMKKSISDDKIMKLMKTEREFIRMLKNKVAE